MGTSQPETSAPGARSRQRTPWAELLLGALSGLYPTDQYLEHMLDRLERMP